ncbi:MAG: FAD-dependent oxidoreductase [Microbacteriaceae bacterium]|nr:FAD-dependent oxidoreductase [Microbacteriaceae bacterium]MCL2794904.1 FAD-dependent oxidoreductase [Microbacteriaceae bacterium]
MTRHLRVAIVGAGPAGIYAGNILSNTGLDVSIDLFETLPAPYGLIRYGVAPDHPRIKGIVGSLHEMLDRGDIRLIGNVEFGRDLTLEDARAHYDAVIFATGASRDAALDIPGIDLGGSYGAADFVSWYDGHPDVPREWPLEAREIAVLGNGNVALDVARVLAKHPHDILRTDIPANVYEGLASSPVTDVHVFGRRGPAHVKFTPIELRELGEVEGVDTIVYDEDFADAEGIDAVAAAAGTNQVKVMTRTMRGWLGKPRTDATRRLHLHFFHAPAEITGDAEGKVEGIRFERTRLTADGAVEGTGEFVEYPVQAVYRAVGYYGSPLPGIPFDERRGVVRNVEGRVVDETDAPITGLYATGWIKRGPVGLIGHTKSDAMETIEHLVSDVDALVPPTVADPDAVFDLLRERGVEFTTWQGWLALDAHEKALGEADASPVVRERVKVVPRDEQVAISNGALAV